MTYVLGLTGSIGMGKSTTASMFADEGVPVWDADQTVRKLYAQGGAAADQIADIHPVVIEDGAVSRAKLRDLIATDAAVLDRIQSIVHPLVAADRILFFKNAKTPIVVLDVPLLFETKADALCNGVVVVSTNPKNQRSRVMARGEMSEADFNMILARQMPDAEKRVRATWVIYTDTLDGARQSVRDILTEINESQNHARNRS